MPAPQSQSRSRGPRVQGRHTFPGRGDSRDQRPRPFLRFQLGTLQFGHDGRPLFTAMSLSVTLHHIVDYATSTTYKKKNTFGIISWAVNFLARAWSSDCSGVSEKPMPGATADVDDQRRLIRVREALKSDILFRFYSIF